tara:strand:+ start:1310 stop:2866 length:1557 start_codon:yes stop_codon:yes gene_type:complete
MNADEDSNKNEWMRNQTSRKTDMIRVSMIRVSANSKSTNSNILNISYASSVATYKKALSYATVHRLSEPYIILQDDIIFSIDIEQLKDSIRHAPYNWHVLQYNVDSTSARKSFCKLQDEFIRWFPEFFSTAITVVRDREVATQIMKRDIYEDHIFDYWLYKNFITYTHTRNWFGIHKFNDKIPYIKNNTECKINIFENAENREEKSIVMMLVTTSLSKYVDNIFQQALIPQYVQVNVIGKKNDYSVRHYDKKNLYIHRWIEKKVFSKWPYFSKLYKFHQKKNHSFDYYLATDDDICFRGFPWITFNAFINEKPKYIISIPRESDFSNSIENLKSFEDNPYRDFFVHNNGDFWRQYDSKDKNRWTYYIDRDQNISADRLNFVEQGTTMFLRHFWAWFLNETESLIDKMKHLNNDWIIDIIWCSALKDFKSDEKCNMFVYPVWHYDFGTLTGFYKSLPGSMSEKLKRSGYKLKKFALENSKFKKWMEDASPAMKTFARIKKKFNPFWLPGWIKKCKSCEK